MLKGILGEQLVTLQAREPDEPLEGNFLFFIPYLCVQLGIKHEIAAHRSQFSNNLPSTAISA
jgi:hypothetical protein